MIQDTSLEVYSKIKGDLGDRQLKVFQTIRKLKYCTDRHIAKSLNWTINKVTPRRGELVKMGLVKTSHTTWDSLSLNLDGTHNKAKYWTISDNVQKGK